MGEPRIALVHDELTRRGGAEVVFEELADLFPEADLFSLYAGYPVMRVRGQLKKVRTSFLQKLPRWFRRHPGRVLPFIPHAAEQFDFSGYDLVISSSSGFAKGIVTRSNVPHVCYCHAPTRYLWDSTHEVVRQYSRPLRLPLRILLHYLRLVDFTAAQRVDVFLANSRFTQSRIKTYYRRNSDVIYPPVDTTFFTPDARSFPRQNSYFLCVGRLTPTKHFDQAIRVCEKLRLPLKIIGVGADYDRLRRAAGRYTQFIGTVDAAQLRRYYRQARALLQPGVEDFGLSTAEALACGTPVIALKKGGVNEIVTSGVTGYLYRSEHDQALAEAIRTFLSTTVFFRPESLQRSVLRFAKQVFRQTIYTRVTRTLELKQQYGIHALHRSPRTKRA